MGTTDQQNTASEATQKKSITRKDESFRQDHLDSITEQDLSVSPIQSVPSLFSDGLAEAFQQEEHWEQGQQREPPQEQEHSKQYRQQLEWAIALANSLLQLGMNLGFNTESAPQMSPREMASNLIRALQHPDTSLQSAASSVIQAMDISNSQALSSEGIDTICNHLSSM